MFTFTWPYIFLLLPLIWIKYKFFPTKHHMDEPLLRVPLIDRIEKLKSEADYSFFLTDWKKFFSLCAWIFLILASANPKWIGEPQNINQQGRNIMLAIDISPSMSIPDLQQGNQLINRLQSIQSVARPFIEKRQGDKLGLILFGSHAYLQTPLTFDHQTVKSMLEDATIGLAGNHTAIGDAIGLALKKLSTENIKSRVLILLTDGGNNTGVINPLDAIQLAKQNNIKIYTVGIGATQLEINNGLGKQIINPSADLDENLLKNIASQTGGKYFRAEDQKTLANILDVINQLEIVRADSTVIRPITALFYWPLALALFFYALMLFPFNLKLSTLFLNLKLTRT